MAANSEHAATPKELLEQASGKFPFKCAQYAMKNVALNAPSEFLVLSIDVNIEPDWLLPFGFAFATALSVPRSEVNYVAHAILLLCMRCAT
jgi:hypothetical protein